MPIKGIIRTTLSFVMCSALLSGQALAENPPPRSNQIEILYLKPQNPAHQKIYEFVKDRRVLERIKDYLSNLRLPRTLLLKMEGCSGQSNAWYESSDNSVTVCYEYPEELKKNAAGKTTLGGASPQDTIYGPLIEVFLHEISHALFDQLKIPILGREEDAADLLAAYAMLNLDKDVVRRTVSGVSFMYWREARSENMKIERMADVHALSSQRLYNLLCIAYGADAQLFADVVDNGWLPKSRAEGCAEEYKQIEYTAEKLLRPYMDSSVQFDVKRRKFLRPLQPD